MISKNSKIYDNIVNYSWIKFRRKLTGGIQKINIIRKIVGLKMMKNTLK